MTILIAATAAVAAFVLADRGDARPIGERPHVPVAAIAVPVLVAIGAVTGSIALLLLGPVLFGCLVLVLRSERRRRAGSRRLAELPIVVDVLARTLGSGATVADAIARLTPEQRGTAGLDEVHHRIRAGQSTSDALSAATGLLPAALFAADAAGVSGAVTVERMADRLRSAALDGRAAQAQSGQQLASAAVMSAMPPLVSVFYGLSDERAAEFYLRTPWGAMVLTASFLLSLAGWFWMRFITRPGPIR